MSFMYPLGLIGLIGIPIVIIIYILRSKYNEQTVSSVYLWRLSEKFLKRKNPLSGLTGLISLILQILTIAVIAFAIARPIFTLPGAANDYYFVLDASGSMNMESGRTTRFELAKKEIKDVIKDAADGSSYSLVCVSGENERIFEHVASKESAIDVIEKLAPCATHCDGEDVTRVAQSYFDSNPSGFVYIVTDKACDNVQNATLINVGTNGENYAVFNAKYSHSAGKLRVTADVISYTSDKELEIELTVDGTAAAAAKIAAKAGEKTPVTLECPSLSFNSFTVSVLNDDIYSLDNQSTTHNLKSEKTYSTLIISENGFFFKAVIDALVDSQVEIVSPEQYPKITEQYGLYIFDSYEPDVLPDASVWLINADRSIENSGFSVRSKVDLGEASAITKSTSTATSVRELLDGVNGADIYIRNYIKYSGMYLKFSTLFTYDGNPLIFAGTNGLGNRQVVFGFNVNESDFALSTDFVMLLGNLIDYSFPSVIEEANFTAGDEAIINVVAGAENIKAFAPSGKEVYLESDGAIATLTLDEVGVYTVSMTLAGEDVNYKIYSGAHPDESAPKETEGSFVISGEPGNERRDGQYDPLMLMFICLAVLFIADWGVYCYEKYQLR